jgi:hypothetical protein
MTNFANVNWVEFKEKTLNPSKGFLKIQRAIYRSLRAEAMAFGCSKADFDKMVKIQVLHDKTPYDYLFAAFWTLKDVKNDAEYAAEFVAMDRDSEYWDGENPDEYGFPRYGDPRM